MEMNTKNKATACLLVANELCKNVKSVGKKINPKPWNTDVKVRTQSELIRKVFDILYDNVAVTNDDSEYDVECLKIAYDLCYSVTTIAGTNVTAADTDEVAFVQAELIKSLFDILREGPSDLSIFDQ
jgi:glyoxylate carboligase